MRSSENINEIGAALAKAQGLMSNAVLNKTNPHFKSKYADLAAIRDAVSPFLAQNGIAALQVIDSDDKGSFLVTRLVHSSGQWIESVHPLPATAKPQEFGSALTYARRYSLAAICGISAEEDDDANGANTTQVETARTPAARTVAPQGKGGKTPTDDWIESRTTEIRALPNIRALNDWERKWDEGLARLKNANPKLHTEMEALLGEMRGKLTNFGIAAE